MGVPWGGATDALVDWTVGATGSGKTWHAMSRAIALAETGRGFLFVDPHRTTVGDIKPYLAGRHADRILEIDLQATSTLGEPVSAGWNPLDLAVVPAELRKGRVDSLKGMLPAALFPDYVGPNAKAPQTSTILRKTLECLLTLNYQLPAQMQANIFCIENLLLDDQWRDLAVGRLPAPGPEMVEQHLPDGRGRQRPVIGGVETGSERVGAVENPRPCPGAVGRQSEHRAVAGHNRRGKDPVGVC